MPYGDWINEFPTGFFLVVHIAAFALGAGFAWLAYKRELRVLGAAFSLFAWINERGPRIKRRCDVKALSAIEQIGKAGER